MRIGKTIWVALAFCMVGTMHTAHAQSTGYFLLQNGASFNFGGLHFSVSGCVLTLNSTTQTSCASYTDSTSNSSTAGAVVFAGAEIGGLSAGVGGSNPVINIEALNNGNGGNLFNNLKAKKNYDLTFALSVARNGSNPTNDITSVTESLFATTGPTGQAADASLIDSAFSNGAANMTVHAGSPSTLTDTFASTSTLTFNIDINLNPSTGAAYTLKSATQQFSPAPEPISISLFVVGLAGIAFSRSCSTARKQPLV